MPWCNLADSPVNQGQEPTQSSLTSGQHCRNVPPSSRKSSEAVQAEVGAHVLCGPAASALCIGITAREVLAEPLGSMHWTQHQCPRAGIGLARRDGAMECSLQYLHRPRKAGHFPSLMFSCLPAALQFTAPGKLEGLFSISPQGMRWVESDRMRPHLHCWKLRLSMTSR